ncbi:MAG: hypothetical protein ACLP59_20800 [Bryobacteraceae bacterium]
MRFNSISRAILPAIFICACAVPKAPAQVNIYISHYFSSDGRTLYQTVTTEGTFSMVVGCSGYTHNYYATANLTGPKGATGTGSGTVGSGSVNACGTGTATSTAQISTLVDGAYYASSNETGDCSYYGQFLCANQGPTEEIDAPVINTGGVTDASNTSHDYEYVDTSGTISIWGLWLDACGTDPSPEITVDDPSHIQLGSPSFVGDQQLNVPFTITSGVATGGQSPHNITVTTPYGTSNPGELYVYDETPVITGVSQTNFIVDDSYAVTISGQHLGTNCPNLQFPFPVTLSPTSQWSCADQSVSIPSVAATSTGSGDLTLTAEGYGGQQFAASPGESQKTTSITLTAVPPDQFTISYQAYIPVDHVNGPDTCLYALVPIGLLYKGDQGRGTYRGAQSLLVVPDGSLSTNQSNQTGTTENYGFGSPVHLPNLSSADEDGVYNDCYLANDIGHAGTSGMSITTSFKSHAATAGLTGSISNPLPFFSFPISWNMAVNVNDSNAASPTAYVVASHTCYPAHTVSVNGTTIYSYVPTNNSTTYLTYCLSGLGYIGPLTGSTYTVPAN